VMRIPSARYWLKKKFFISCAFLYILCCKEKNFSAPLLF